MYCSQCGKIMDDGAKFCTGCGRRFEDTTSYVGQTASSQNMSQPYIVQSNGPQQTYTNVAQTFEAQNQNQQEIIKPKDKGGFWWFVFGFVFSGIISIVLYFVWRAEYPKRAKSILWGFCSMWVITIVASIILTAVAPDWWLDYVNG